MTWFSEKMFISNICKCGLIPNLFKKSWTISTINVYILKINIISVTLISNIEKKIPKIRRKSREKMQSWFFHIANFNPLNYANVHKGAFNNYVNQILPKFDPHLLEWTKIEIFPLSSPHPLSILRSYWMTLTGFVKIINQPQANRKKDYLDVMSIINSNTGYGVSSPGIQNWDIFALG